MPDPTDPNLYAGLSGLLLGFLSLGTQVWGWVKARAERQDKAEAEAKAKAARAAELESLREAIRLEAMASAKAEEARELAAHAALEARLVKVESDSRDHGQALTLLRAAEIRAEGDRATLRRDVDALDRRTERSRAMVADLTTKVGETLAGLQAEVRHLAGNGRGGE